MTATSKTTLLASIEISSICKDLRYSRGHVARILRENAGRLRARRVDGRWRIPSVSVPRLRKLVEDSSGVRYKLGERGAHK